jgi:hypothetical protein
MEWFAIRSVYKFGETSSGKNIFEERVVCFEAKNLELAHKKAEEEAESYAADNEFDVHDEQVGYRQDGDNLIDGYEVWSELFESDLTLNEFYNERYSKYVYHPESV